MKDSDIIDLRVVKLLALYLQAKDKNDATKKEEIVKEIKDIVGENSANQTVQIVSATIVVHEGLLEDALRILVRNSKNLEKYVYLDMVGAFYRNRHG